ncbi:dCTP deaminase [Dyella jiangningensis]|uniref:dCTP deaminase n=1 Tax=Dyella jiangningensis TaxID=1379159 RepID=UPI00240EDF5C|nr:dCTP deaminase [Dyella jiangningensis]MDG2539213.1 dCTP deaminase [Dyella jiangningensis]
MILTGNHIKAEVLEKRIIIEPFFDDRLTTNSYDLTLGDSLVAYEEEVLNPKAKPKTREIKIPEDGFVMQRGDFLLGCSNETVGSEHYVPIIHAKSSVARLGLFIHITSGLFDIGCICDATFHLYATLPVRLYAGMPIAQITFWKTKGEIKLYNGKYQGDRGIAPSRIYRDFVETSSDARVTIA